MTDIAERLRLSANDPMWADHCEISKALVAKAADRIEELTKALTLAEDVLSRFPFSTAIWPNGMHPQIGITQIRAALEERK